MHTVSEIFKVKSDAKTAFDVIKDFESYPDFIPEVSNVKVTKKGSNQLEVSFTVHILIDSHYTLKFHFKPHSKIKWEFVSGDYIKSNEGFWAIRELSKNTTEITYSAEVELSWLVPKMIATELIEKNLPKMIECFRKRIEKKFKAK